MPEPARAIGKCVAEYRMSESGFVKLGAIMVGCAVIGGGMVWFRSPVTIRTSAAE